MNNTSKTLLFFYLSTFFLHSTIALEIKDLTNTDPYSGMVKELVDSKAFSLDKFGNFQPKQFINKASFLKAALFYAGYKPSKTFNFYTGFSDVPEESWFAPYVKKAIDSRIIQSPKAEEKFSPDSSLTRQEALVLTMSIFGIPTPITEINDQTLFTDIRKSHPLAHLYQAAYNNGIYFEDSQENFYPNKILNRQDAADLLFKARFASAKYNSGTNQIIDYHPTTPVSINSGTETNITENEKFGILADVWNKINQTYVYTDKVNQDQLLYGAISGMVDQLNDPYSNYRSPNSDGTSFIYVPENYEGIGAVIENVDNLFLIQTTLNNSPANRAGLKSKDIIWEINGQSIQDMQVDQVNALIKGKAGTNLKLKIKRENLFLNFDITREKIGIESVHLQTLSNNISLIRIDQFTENSYQEFEKILPDLKNSSSKKIIIDLRNNPGGYLTSTQAILGHFLGTGQTEFYTQDKDQNLISYASNGNAEFKDFKAVILINEGSASAAEIMAGALQDTKLAYLIGTISFGKGSVQEITNYNDNSSLKLTIAQWLTPNKRNINHIGLKPDLEVKITDQQKASGEDPQLQAALNYLR